MIENEVYSKAETTVIRYWCPDRGNYRTERQPTMTMRQAAQCVEAVYGPPSRLIASDGRFLLVYRGLRVVVSRGVV